MPLHYFPLALQNTLSSIKHLNYNKNKCVFNKLTNYTITLFFQCMTRGKLFQLQTLLSFFHSFHFIYPQLKITSLLSPIFYFPIFTSLILSPFSFTQVFSSSTLSFIFLLIYSISPPIQTLFSDFFHDLILIYYYFVNSSAWGMTHYIDGHLIAIYHLLYFFNFIIYLY